MSSKARGAESWWSEATFRALTDSCGDIISLLDEQGRLVFNSSAAERISGFSRQELADVDTFTFIHPDDREATQRVFAHVLMAPGTMVTAQYRYRHKSGGWTWMEAVATNHLDDPEVRGVVAVSRDISQQKATEEALRRLVAENEHLLTEVRREAERKRAFLAGLSHELRNPLAAIRSSVQALGRMAGFDADARSAVATLERQSAHLARLTNDILTVTRDSDAKVPLETSSVPPAPTNARPRTILIIDDHVDAAEGLRMLLALAGHRVETVHLGAAGVSRAYALAPDVVLCDIGLPDMDGYAVAKALRSHPVTAATRLIALSGFAYAEDQQRALEAGFDVHVAKPVDVDTLEHLVAASVRTDP